MNSESMGPRWKGKNFVDIAKANPISQIIKQLQSSMTLSNSRATLIDCNIIFEASVELSDLLKCLCIGHNPLKNRPLFEFSFEEAFYLHNSLKCLQIIMHNNGHVLREDKLWDYMKSKQLTFPEFYMAYAYFRNKNWVVKKTSNYGGDFVAYRHHPKLVHSEYTVLVMIEGDARLKEWSDFLCRLRVSVSVAKELLVLSVNKNGSDARSPLCSEQFSVHVSKIERWVPEKCRENFSANDEVDDEILY